MASVYSKELAYLMKFNEIDRIPIYDGNEFRGIIKLDKNNDLVYEHKYCRYYMYDGDAFEAGKRQLNEVLDAYKRFADNTEEISVVASYTDSDDTYNREETWSGKIFEVMDRLYDNNHRLKYCNGCSWKFKDTAVQHLYLLWNQYLDYSGKELSHYMAHGGDMW